MHRRICPWVVCLPLAGTTAFGAEFESRMEASFPVEPMQPRELNLMIGPVIDNGITGDGYDRVKDYWREFSPIHNLRDDMPPPIGFIAEREHGHLSEAPPPADEAAPFPDNRITSIEYKNCWQVAV